MSSDRIPPTRMPSGTSGGKLRLALTADLVQSLCSVLGAEIEREHEAIAYLLGLSTGTSTLAITAIKPDAVTTWGSFDVSASAMARVVRAAADRGLHVVGQIHTHPKLAYHSDGDEEGARIAYSGYASIVLPDYGTHLPSLAGAATFMYQRGEGFVELSDSQLVLIEGTVS
jgi:proteasome lid subunit RPN8/RPN11